MSLQTLYFGNPAYLSKKQKQVHVQYPKDSDKQESTVPIEDVGFVVIDHPRVTVTHALTNALINNNAAILWCDDYHLPNGMVLPFSANHTFAEKLRFQLYSSAPLKKQLWKQTIQAKIYNQAAVLKKAGKNYKNLLKWRENVTSGDPDNIEARASAYYWKHLFSDFDQLVQPFIRDRYGTPPNNQLNYGYAILRSIVARSLVTSGCLPALGIHHRNKYNPFCLADDIMEPYRPFVDYYVLSQLDPVEEPVDILEQEEKQNLLQIPVLDVKVGSQYYPLMTGMQRTTSSLMECFEKTAKKINYPVFE